MRVHRFDTARGGLPHGSVRRRTWSLTERFRIDGREIAQEDFARLATRVRAAESVQADGLTHPRFELITAVCFLYFDDQRSISLSLKRGWEAVWTRPTSFIRAVGYRRSGLIT